MGRRDRFPGKTPAPAASYVYARRTRETSLGRRCPYYGRRLPEYARTCPRRHGLLPYLLKCNFARAQQHRNTSVPDRSVSIVRPSARTRAPPRALLFIITRSHRPGVLPTRSSIGSVRYAPRGTTYYYPDRISECNDRARVHTHAIMHTALAVKFRITMGGKGLPPSLGI